MKPTGHLVEATAPQWQAGSPGGEGYYLVHPDDQAKWDNGQGKRVVARFYGPLADAALVAALRFHVDPERLSNQDRMMLADEGWKSTSDIDYLKDQPRENGWKGVQFLPISGFRMTPFTKTLGVKDKATLIRWVNDMASTLRAQ